MKCQALTVITLSGFYCTKEASSRQRFTVKRRLNRTNPDYMRYRQQPAAAAAVVVVSTAWSVRPNGQYKIRERERGHASVRRQ